MVETAVREQTARMIIFFKTLIDSWSWCRGLSLFCLSDMVILKKCMYDIYGLSRNVTVYYSYP